jgi:hypothetical protein
LRSQRLILGWLLELIIGEASTYPGKSAGCALGQSFTLQDLNRLSNTAESSQLGLPNKEASSNVRYPARPRAQKLPLPGPSDRPFSRSPDPLRPDPGVADRRAAVGVWSRQTKNVKKKCLVVTNVVVSLGNYE